MQLLASFDEILSYRYNILACSLRLSISRYDEEGEIIWIIHNLEKRILLAQCKTYFQFGYYALYLHIISEKDLESIPLFFSQLYFLTILLLLDDSGVEVNPI